MEATAAIYTTETSSIADRVNDYLAATNGSIASIAREINYSRPTISRYLAGKYDSDATDLERKLIGFLREHGQEVETSDGSVLRKALKKRTDIFESCDMKKVIGVCSAAQEDIGLGIVVAKSGFGKTYALKYYAKMPRVAYVECDDTMSSRDLVEAIERALGIPSSYGTIWRRVNGIREFCNVNKGYLIIIDEADKLISKYTQKKMEILRGIYDQADVGLVIAGEPRLEAQIKTYLNRFANRVDFYASLKGLSGEEVESYLDGYSIDPDALQELKARACNSQTGCFRLFDRTLNNIIRILNATGETTITIKVIAQASDMMML